MFRKQIANAEDKLVSYRERQLASVKGVLQRSAAEQDGGIMDDVVRLWRKIIVEEKGDACQQRHLRECKAKLANMQQSAIDNNKKVMTRMSAGSDLTLKDLCMQSWIKFIEEYNRNRDFEDAVKRSEQQLADSWRSLPRGRATRPRGCSTA